jgi:hypothetical protein
MADEDEPKTEVESAADPEAWRARRDAGGVTCVWRISPEALFPLRLTPVGDVGPHELRAGVRFLHAGVTSR